MDQLDCPGDPSGSEQLSALAADDPGALAPASRGDLLSEPVDARTDTDAVNLWLRSHEGSRGETVRAYRFEATRFLAWLADRKGRTDLLLPTANLDDGQSFVDWLQRPTRLKAQTLKQYGLARQPVLEGLSGRSVMRSIAILGSLYSACQDMVGPHGSQFVRASPFRLVKGKVRRAGREAAVATRVRGRVITVDLMRQVFLAASGLPGSTPRELAIRHQTLWLLHLLYHGLLRRFESASATMGDLVQSSGGLRLRVLGKGGTEQEIVVVASLERALRDYRSALGLPELPKLGEPWPLVLHHCPPGGDRTIPLSTPTIYRRLVTVFRLAAEAVSAAGDDAGAALLRRASPHWLRHSGVSHLLDSGADPRHVQELARHASLQTTGIYDHKEEDALRAGLNLATDRLLDRLGSSDAPVAAGEPVPPPFANRLPGLVTPS